MTITTPDTSTPIKHPVDPALAVARKLSTGPQTVVDLDEMVRWATGPVHEAEASTRLIVGSPGSGKSWFLSTLYHSLRETQHTLVLWLNPLDWKDEEGWKWHKWLASPKAGDILDSAGIQHDKSVPAHYVWYSAVSRLTQRCILLVDGYDALDDEERDMLYQEFLLPYIYGARFPDFRRMVIATRDTDGIERAAIRDEAKVFELEPLPHTEDDNLAREQIRLRCDRLNAAIEDWRADRDDRTCRAKSERILDRPTPLTDEDFEIIIGWNEDRLNSLPARLEPRLTGNPFINNLVLWYALHNNGDLTDADGDKIWRDYLQRAKLIDENDKSIIPDALLKEMHASLPEVWTERDFATKFGYGKLDELEPLFEQGVLVSSQGNFRYNPEFAALLRLPGANRPAA